jgi:hypothetical protein
VKQQELTQETLVILNGGIKGLIRWLCSCTFVLGGFLSTTRAQQNPKSAVDPVQAANKMAAMTHDWIKGKASSPGTSVDVRETMRAKDGGRLIVKYNVYVNGASKDQTYALVQWPTNAPGPSEILHGLSISAEGLLVCAGRTPEQCGEADKKDDPVNLTFYPAKGEVQRLALISADQNAKVFFAIVPDPIVQKDKGCSLEVIRLTPKFELALILAKGFQPGEELQLTSNSYNESQDHKQNADSSGEYASALLPFVKNKRTGKTNLTLKGASCGPALSFEWGE